MGMRATLRRSSRRTALAVFLSAVAFLGAGCGGGGDTGVFDIYETNNDILTFVARDLTIDNVLDSGYYYDVTATKVAEGDRCVIYLEGGRQVAQATIDILTATFDNAIYPGVTGAFGSEPNPGIDGHPKVFILLLDVRDGFAGSGSYTAGYFSAINEYPDADVRPYNLRSNEKELLYIDIFPGNPTSPFTLRTIAHEFQHMVHFNESERNKGSSDDTWLNEAMSEVSPLYCGFGADYGRVSGFEENPGDTLTAWGDDLADYNVVHMWSVYFKDRYSLPGDNTIFWKMLHSAATGASSVDAALSGTGKDFRSTFLDWSIAVYSGNALSWPGHPEWSYQSLNTWPGTYDGVTLGGLFADPSRWNVTAIGPMAADSVAFYRYTGGSQVTWTIPPGSGLRASLGDNAVLFRDLASGSTYPYTAAGYLAVASDNTGGQGSVTPSVPVRKARTVSEFLRNAGRHHSVRSPGRGGDGPTGVCVHPFLEREARELVKGGVRPAALRAK